MSVFREVLGRFKTLVVALRPLTLPVYSMHFMLDRFKNPVVTLELSKRYKNAAYVVVMITVYAMYAVYSFLVLVDVVTKTWRSNPPFSYFSAYPEDYWDFGELFGFAAGFTVWPVVGMIFLVVPVLAAVSVAGERRHGTLMLVQLSSLRPFDIVWGKIVASVAPVLFPVVVCVVALVAFSLFSLVLNMDEANVYRLFGSVLGGPGVGAGLVVLSMAVSVVCVLCSTFAKSSASAITMSYGLFFSMIFVLPFVLPLVRRLIFVVPLVGGLLGRVVSGYVVFAILLLAWIVGLPFWCLWACKRLRLPGR